MQRAELAGRARRGLAILRANPLATAGSLVVIATAAFCFLGPTLYHTDQTHVFLSRRICRRALAIRSAPTPTALTSSAG